MTQTTIDNWAMTPQEENSRLMETAQIYMDHFKTAHAIERMQVSIRSRIMNNRIVPIICRVAQRSFDEPVPTQECKDYLKTLTRIICGSPSSGFVCMFYTNLITSDPWLLRDGDPS